MLAGAASERFLVKYAAIAHVALFCDTRRDTTHTGIVALGICF